MTTTNSSVSSTTNGNYTELGTRIVKAGDDMDKNAFLSILSAELANQDPTKDTDSTQYVSQLAQFASMEQMNNLNNTLADQANMSLVGKTVILSDTDSDGNKISGIVDKVTSQNGKGTVTMIVNQNGKYVEKDFNVDDVESVVAQDSNLAQSSAINSNVQYMFASSLIGKNVQITDTDSSGNAKTPVSGIVKGAYKENGIVYVKVLLSSGETTSYSYDKVTNVGE